jgi:hypothetical protein
VLAEAELSFRRRLLKFATGSTNVPMGGFGSIQPRFTVQVAAPLAKRHTPDVLATHVVRHTRCPYTISPAYDSKCSNVYHRTGGQARPELSADHLATSSTCVNMLLLPVRHQRGAVRRGA